MYTLNKTYPAIRSLFTLGPKHYFITRRSELLTTDLNVAGLLPPGYEITFNETDGIFYYCDADADVHAIDTHSGKQSQLQDLKLKFNYSFNDKVMCEIMTDKGSSSLLFDLRTRQTIWEKDFLLKTLYADNSIVVGFEGRAFSTVFLYNAETGEERWSFHLTALPSFLYQGEPITDYVTRLIGVNENTIWLCTKGNRIVGIDINSGAMVHFVEWVKEDFVPRSAEANLNEDGTLIYLLSEFFCIINASNGNIIRKEKIPALKDYRVVNTAYKNNYIYFSACMRASGQTRFIGIFDVVNQNVLWFYDMGFDNRAFLPAGKVPQPVGDNLFIIDSEHILYQFNRS